PTVYRNLLLVGANVPEQPATGQPGNTRAYDARTGERVWEFHSVPQAGETGNETWPAGEWKDRTGANNWGFYMTVDAERNTVYTVFGSPASDYYGFDRKGNNLFGNSVVALDAMTGKLKWYFQTVHHDLWDMDLPPAPILLDVTVKGKKIPALAQTGKLGLVFILNRVTGEPVFGVEERPVPQTTVPGEWTSPTQPFPVKPLPLARNSFKKSELSKVTPEHEAFCKDLWDKNELTDAEPYMPWSLYRNVLVFPGAQGGS